MNTLTLGRDALHGMSGAEREWLVTNGIGGFASSSVNLMNTRRYHGLLFASLRPPVERVALVSKLDVTVLYGDSQIPLAANEFADGTIAPRGFRHLESFRLEGLVPVWTWQIGDARVEQRLWMRHGENTTYVQFTRIGGSKELRLKLEPLCTYRDYHWQPRGERAFRVDPVHDGVQIVAYDGAQPYRILCTDARIEIQPQWHWNFRHRDETARGLDDIEDLFRPAIVEVDLPPGQTRAVILTAEHRAPMPAAEALAAERARQQEILARFAAAPRGSVAGADVAAEQLALAADQFLVERRDARGTPLGKTVIAGYPWFSDWGRDTMIALPGLTLATGREEIARSVLRTFARFVSQGMLPNRFPDAGEAPEYNTVDASLWYFVAVHSYLKHTGDRSFRAEIYPTLKDMLDWHTRGTRFGIQVDPTDGLLRAGQDGVQLTWMDAKVGDWVVTPRIGKPVEINALWCNALETMAALAPSAGRSGEPFAKMAAMVKRSFGKFWNSASGCCYDVIDAPGIGNDASLRPNQIFAVSLPESPLTPEQQRAVVDVCARRLLTSHGLRSLAQEEPGYQGRYGGAPRERDGAYHQGTVWGWLMGPFVLAHLRVYQDRRAALSFLEPLGKQITSHGLGTLSEIFDGDAPFTPRGCIAQAWTVGEVLRAWRATLG